MSQGSSADPVRFSTAVLPARERVPFWREEFGRKLVHVDVEPLGDAGFEATATLRMLSDVRRLSCLSTPARTRRTRDLVADGDDSFALLINLSGELEASQLGRHVVLEPGDAALFLHSDPAVMRHAAFQHEGLVIARSALEPLVAGVEDKAMRLIPRNNEALRLLVRYLQILDDHLALPLPAVSHAVATHIQDLVALAIGASADGAAIAQERGTRAVRLATIKADVIENSRDRALTLAAVAVRHGLSPRSVQLLFEDEGVSFSQFLLEQRLTVTHRMLRDPRRRAMTISAIAAAAGFGDLSHFNRVFRRRYGATPSDIRHAGARNAPG